MGKCYRPLALLALLLGLATAPGGARAEEVVGGRGKPARYHRAGCRQVALIKPSRLVRFARPEEAQEAAFKPCKLCNPPIAEKPGAPPGTAPHPR